MEPISLNQEQKRTLSLLLYYFNIDVSDEDLTSKEQIERLCQHPELVKAGIGVSTVIRDIKNQ